jgi:hypothetical protein
MSARLSHEIAKLASEARHYRVHDHSIIKELTMVVGFGHLAEMYPREALYSDALRKHLQRFMDLACGHEHAKLCQHSQRIVELLDGDLADVA